MNLLSLVMAKAIADAILPYSRGSVEFRIQAAQKLDKEAFDFLSSQADLFDKCRSFEIAGQMAIDLLEAHRQR